MQLYRIEGRCAGKAPLEIFVLCVDSHEAVYIFNNDYARDEVFDTVRVDKINVINFNPEEMKAMYQMRQALEAILDYEPEEVIYDELAYKRLVESYREAAENGLKEEEGISNDC